MEFELQQDNVGLNPVRSFGNPVTMLPITLDFSDVTDYPTGGEEIDLSNYFNYGDGENVILLISPKDGYIFEYDNDNEKVKVYEGDGTDGIKEVDNDDDISSLEDVHAIAFGY